MQPSRLVPLALGELPAELVLAIMEYVEGASKSEASTRSARRCLSACSRTCRQWYKRFRPLLFQRLILRSAADLRHLLELLANRSSPISGLIEHIEIQELAGSARWAQTILPLLHRRLPQLSTITQRTTAKPHTVFSDQSSTPLPILMPVAPAAFASGFRSVKSLYLKNYNYCSFAVLVRYLAAFPELNEVHLSRVTWSNTLASALHTHSLKTSSSLALATAAGCTSNLAILRLFSQMRTHARFSAGLSHREVLAIISLAEALQVEGSESSALYITSVRRMEGELPLCEDRNRYVDIDRWF